MTGLRSIKTGERLEMRVVLGRTLFGNVYDKGDGKEESKGHCEVEYEVCSVIHGP